MSEQRQLAAIMFTDFVNYSGMMARDEHLALNCLRQQRRLLEPLRAKHGAVLHKEIGDGTLSTFGSAQQAIDCAMELQAALRDAEAPFQIRIGVHVGEVLFSDSDVYGDGINISARIVRLADPGGSVVSDSCYDALRSLSYLRFDSLGEKSLKNIARPVIVYRVLTGNAKHTGAGREAPSVMRRLLARMRAHRARTALLFALAVTILISALSASRMALLDNELGARIAGWFGHASSADPEIAKTPALAVLPFQDLSADASSTQFGDTTTDEVIQALGRVQGLKVVARRAIDSPGEGPRDIQALGEMLDVDLVLEGTIKLEDNRVRVTAQMSSTKDGYVLWADTFEAAVDDVLALRERFTRGVVNAISRRYSVSLGLPQNPAISSMDPTAYQLYLNGRQLIKQRGRGALHNATDLLQKSIALAPEFAPSRIELAKTTVLLPFYDTVDEEEMFQRATAMLDELKPGDQNDAGAVEFIRAFVADQRWQWIGAEEHYARGLKLNPNDPNAHVWYSQHLAMVGRMNESLKAAQRAEELDNVSAVVHNRLAITYLWNGDNRRAEEQFAASSRLGYMHLVHPGYLVFLQRTQRWEEMRKLFATMLQADGRQTGWIGPLFEQFRNPSARVARKACDAAIAAGDMPPRSEFGLWLLLGEVDRAYTSFERYRAGRLNIDIEFIFAAEGRGFRNDPRFATLSDSIGLVEYWTKYGPPDASR